MGAGGDPHAQQRAREKGGKKIKDCAGKKDSTESDGSHCWDGKQLS